MPNKTIGKTCIAPLSIGSIYSFKLRGTLIIPYLFGLIPVRPIELADVSHLRLATYNEVPVTYIFFNWPQFLAVRRAKRPVYVLKPRNGRPILLKPEGDGHFKLRQAIARQQRSPYKAAA